MLYGQLVGHWKMEAKFNLDEPTPLVGLGEIHFGWILQGQSILDVWHSPGVFHGCAVRTFFPERDEWHIHWTSHGRACIELRGRASGRDIVQQGRAADGTEIRWTFTDISDSFFFWRGERSSPDDGSWVTHAEIAAKRLDLGVSRSISMRSVAP